MGRLSRALFVICIFLLVVSAAYAQVTGVTDSTSTPIEGTGHDYIKLLSETVNPANGSVSLRLQVPTPKARGITIPFTFSYDSNSVNHLTSAVPNPGDVEWQSNAGYLSQGGWSFSVPMASESNWTETDGTYPANTWSCDTFSNYMFSDVSGGQHQLGLATQYSGAQVGLCSKSGSSVASGGDPEVRASLPNTHPDPNYNPNATSYSPLTVSTSDGTVYTFSNFSHSLATSPARFSLPSTIEDRNGNIIAFTDNNNGNFSAQDTAGRAAISSNGFGPSGATNTLSVGGLTYQVVWTTTTTNFPAPPGTTWVGNYPGSPASQGPNGEYDQCNSGVPAANTTQTVVSEIILPNGQKYQFHYGTDNSNPSFQNPYGLLNEIEYPTGGWVMYSWKFSDTVNEFADYPGSYEVACGDNNCVAPVQDGCLYQYKSLVVNQREVSFTGGAPSLTQSFTYDTYWGATGTSAATAWTSKTTNVVTTDNVRNESETVIYTYSPIAQSTNDPLDFSDFSIQLPVESSVQYFDFSGSLLKTVTKTWNNQYQLASEQEQWPMPIGQSSNTISSKTTYSYTPQFSLVTAKSEYNYGSTLFRQTNTNYQAFAATPTGGVIADEPCQVITYDGNNNRYAETDYFYDGGSTLCGTAGTPSVTGLSGLASGTHDETHYGSGSTSPRGNLTQKTQWGSGGASPVTTYKYDETGQVLSKLDPCGYGTCSDMTGSSHTTTYGYADSYTVLSGGTNSSYTPTTGKTNAYLTSVTDPLGHTENFTYDYYGGQLTVFKDENSQFTKYLIMIRSPAPHRSTIQTPA